MSKRQHRLESSDSDGEVPVKKSSQTSSKAQRPAPKARKEADEEEMIDLTGRKFVCVREFRGVLYVDIREYYNDRESGDLKPGKKGIALNQSQWNALKNSIDDISDMLKNKR